MSLQDNSKLTTHWLKSESHILSSIQLESVTYIVIFQGYCGWALVKYDRLLLPSNPQVGVLRYREHYYAFSDKQAAEEFAERPDVYVLLYLILSDYRTICVLHVEICI